eukprot:3951218-Pleurochrysis_carterae.AAC.1
MSGGPASRMSGGPASCMRDLRRAFQRQVEVARHQSAGTQSRPPSTRRAPSAETSAAVPVCAACDARARCRKKRAALEAAAHAC